jgi:hypothetical protein
MRKPVTLGIVGIICLIALLCTDRTAFAQAGSTGGTLGKTDKSASGGEEQAAPLRHAPRHVSEGSTTKQGLPPVFQLTEHGLVGTYSVTLRHVGGSTYQGTWGTSGELSTQMTVTMTPTTMVVQRRDTKNSTGGPLYVSTYSGTRAGHSASGTFHHTNGYEGTWEASW